MKKIICADDVEKCIKQGDTTLCVFPGQILTPSARDAARDAGLEVCEGKTEAECTACKSKAAEAPADDEISGELVYTALKTMLDNGMLKGVAHLLSR
ncbi:MAG: hypothetical protein MI742_10915 [Desulfobacterales bacterium]|nr:hypothetical protein [Desulfobacterales bacterium]